MELTAILVIGIITITVAIIMLTIIAVASSTPCKRHRVTSSNRNDDSDENNHQKHLAQTKRKSWKQPKKKRGIYYTADSKIKRY